MGTVRARPSAQRKKGTGSRKSQKIDLIIMSESQSEQIGLFDWVSEKVREWFCRRAEMSIWRVVQESLLSFERTWFIEEPRAGIARVEEWILIRGGQTPVRGAYRGALHVLGTRLPLEVSNNTQCTRDGEQVF